MSNLYSKGHWRLENMKELINSKLQSSEPSLPEIKFANAENELELAKKIQTGSFFEKGYE